MKYITEVTLRIIADDNGLREVRVVKYVDIGGLDEEENEGEE